MWYNSHYFVVMLMAIKNDDDNNGSDYDDDDDDAAAATAPWTRWCTTAIQMPRCQHLDRSLPESKVASMIKYNISIIIISTEGRCPLRKTRWAE